MSIYETVKASVTARAAAERYGVSVSRSGMACCIFHEDKHPSMKLDERYYCFGCGATGDAVDFTAWLFGLSPYEAAKKLAYDFGLSVDRPSVIARIKARPPNRDNENRCFSVLTDYLHLLESWLTDYAPKTPDEPFDDRFIEACHKTEYIRYLTDLVIEGTPDERRELAAALLNDGIVQKIERKLEEVYGRNKKQRNFDLAI